MNAHPQPSRPVVVRGEAAGFAQTIAIGLHTLKTLTSEIRVISRLKA